MGESSTVSDPIGTSGGVMLTTRSIMLFAPAALLLSACNSTGPHAAQRINVSAMIASGPSAQPGPARDVIVSGSGGSVRITSAQIVLSHIKLANDAACSRSTDDDANDVSDANDATEGPEANEPDDANNDEHDCEPVRVDPVQVNLPLDGTTKVILDALVTAGSYTGLRAAVDTGQVGGGFT